MTEPRGEGCSAARWWADGLTVAAAWRALRAAFEAEAASASPSAESAKLFWQGRPVSEPEQWPHCAPAVLDPEAWAAAFAGGSYFAWARAVQTHDRPLFEAVVEAAAAVFGRRGFQSGPVEVEVFFGDYGFTPGGIHREACSNLHLVLGGAKRMHFWPPSGWPPPDVPRRIDVACGAGTREEYLSDLDPTAVLGAARSLTADAGAGFAWDAGVWHVGETRGPALAMNIAAYQRGLESERPLPTWGEELDGAVPAEWLASYGEHVVQSGTPAALLARVSALGLRPAPPARQPTLGRVGRWRLAVPVLLTTASPGEVLVATLGSARRHRASTSLVDWLIARPRPGTEVVIPPDLRRLAGWLHEQGVFDVAPDGADSDTAPGAGRTPDPMEGR